MKTRLIRAICVFLTVGTAPAAVAQQTIVAGRSIGRVWLGMARAEVVRALGRPTVSLTLPSVRLPAPHPAGRYTVSEWRSGGAGPAGRTLTVTFRDGRVAQIQTDSSRYATTGGVSVATPFRRLRLRFPHMRVDQYGFGEIEKGEEMGGHVGFYVDSVRNGIAFTVGTQDDEATYDALPHAAPQALIVHTPGRRVLPTIADPHVRVMVEPRRLNDYLTEMRDWFDGGPLKKVNKDFWD